MNSGNTKYTTIRRDLMAPQVGLEYLLEDSVLS